jgi:hypothetical protein
MAFKYQRIRDPLHNLIEFRPAQFEDVLWRVIQTGLFRNRGASNKAVAVIVIEEKSKARDPKLRSAHDSRLLGEVSRRSQR